MPLRMATSYPSKDFYGEGYSVDQDYLHTNSVGIYTGELASEVQLNKRQRRDYYFCYNYEGRMILLLEGTRYEIKPGDFFVLYAGQPYSYWHIKDGNVQNYWVHFTGFGARPLVAFLCASGKQVFSPGKHIENGFYFSQILDELHEKKPGYQMACTGFLLQLVTALHRQINRDNKIKTKNQAIVDSLQYFYKHYREKISIAQLAQIAHLSEKSYSNKFYKYTGHKPQKYMTMYRVERAIELITLQTLNMNEVAEQAGFNNQMYFSRVFKKHMDMTPSQYLENIKKGLLPGGP